MHLHFRNYQRAQRERELLNEEELTARIGHSRFIRIFPIDYDELNAKILKSTYFRA